MKRMKRAISLLLVLVMVLGLLPGMAIGQVAAETVQEDGGSVPILPELNANYDAEAGQVTVSGLPLGAASLILAGYRDDQMVFSKTEDVSDVPVVLPVAADADFDTLKVFCLDADSVPLTEAKEVFCSVDTFTVTFAANGDNVENLPETQQVYIGQCAVKPKDPTREGYFFDGWYKDECGTEEFAFEDNHIGEDLILYAKWFKGQVVSSIEPCAADTPIVIYSFTADECDVLVGTEETITFEAEVFFSTGTTNVVALIDEEGNHIGIMNDDGENGDRVCNDGIYTIAVKFAPEEVANVRYFVNVGDIVSNGINICCYKEIADSDFDVYDFVCDRINDELSIYNDEDGFLVEEKYDEAISAAEKVLDELQEEGYVESFSVDYDGYCIEITLINHIPVIHAFARKDMLAGIAAYETYEGRITPLYPSGTVRKCSEKIRKEFPEIYTKYWDYKENYSLYAIKNISDASIILWEGHANCYTDIGSALVTGLTTEEYFSQESDENISADITSGRVYLSSGGNVLISGGFVDKYVDNMDGAFVFLTACRGSMDTERIWNDQYSLVYSFINKGATAVVAHDENIDCGYGQNIMSTTIDYMTMEFADGYMELGTALDLAKSLTPLPPLHQLRSPGRPYVYPQNSLAAHRYTLNQTTKSTWSVAGTVTKKYNDDIVIPNAVVAVYNRGGNQLFSATRTDENGWYTVNVPAGEYQLAVWADDYKTAYKYFTVGNSDVTENIQMEAANEYLVTGKISEPIGGVSVRVYDGDALIASTTTGSKNGEYSLVLSEGEYRFEFSADGYKTEKYVHAIPRVGNKPLPTYELEAEEGVIVETITGRVVDANEKPIAGARIDFYRNWNPHYTVEKTAQDGTFTISADDLLWELGEYTYTIECQGYVSCEKGVCQLKAGNNNLGDIGYLRPKGAFSVTHSGYGDVLDKAAKEGGIEFCNGVGTAHWTVTGAANITKTGNWFNISTAANDDGSQELTISVTGYTLSKNTGSITFTTEDGTNHTVSVYQEAHNVTGTVTDGVNPIQGASVVVWNSLGFRSEPYVTGADGKFSIPYYDAWFQVTVTADGFDEKTVNSDKAMAQCDVDVGTIAMSGGATTSGKCGDDLTWILNESGLLTISGTGEMWNMFNYETHKVEMPWGASYEEKSRITSVVIEDGVTSIGGHAFSECHNLSTASIPDTVKKIGMCAFTGTKLSSVSISKYVTEIGGQAFSYCDLLEAFNVDMANPNYCDVDGVLYSKDMETLYWYPAQKMGATYEIPSTVKTLEANAFMDTAYLASVYIPASVKSIHSYLTVFGGEKLTDICVDGGNTGYCDIDGVLFSKDKTKLIHYPTAREDQIYEIPCGTTTIGFQAFQYRGRSKIALEMIIIPEGVTTLEDYAFNGMCASVVVVAKTVRNVGNSALNLGMDGVSGTVFFLGDVPEEWGNMVLRASQNIGYIEGKQGWSAPTWTAPDGMLYANVFALTEEAWMGYVENFEEEFGITLPSA